MTKKLLSLAFLPFIVCSCSNVSKIMENKKDINVQYVEEKVTFSPRNKFAYKLEHALTKAPNTFESWIKVPTNSLGGMIAGNYMFSIGTTSDITLDWGIDVTGRFKILWGCTGLNYTFPGVFLNDDTWHHVALTRNPSTHVFTFYVDGVQKGLVVSRQKDKMVPSPMIIGSDNRQWILQREMFDGDIKEVVMYDDTLTADDIKLDFETGRGYNQNHRDHVIGDWYLGESWENLIVNSEVGDNRAYLISQDKYVNIAPVEDYDYTIMALPDIQSMVDFPRENWDENNSYYGTMKWIGDHIESDNIAFALQVGDIVNDGQDDIQFYHAKNGFDLWNNKLPYATVPGNHDYTDNCITAPTSSRDLLLYNNYFGVDTVKDFKEFGGVYEENHIENAYYLFEAGNIKYCVIALEFLPRLSVIKWAGRICEMFPDRRVIVMTHCYNDYYGRISGSYSSWNKDTYKYFKAGSETTYGTELWDGLVKRYKNIFMTISGHYNADDPVIYKNHGDNGNPIINMLIDWQCTNIGRDITYSINPLDIIVPLKFNETKKEIYFRAISPKYNKAYNLQGQMTISFADWQEPLEAKY